MKAAKAQKWTAAKEIVSVEIQKNGKDPIPKMSFIKLRPL
jgi:hypothetical protein